MFEAVQPTPPPRKHHITLNPLKTPPPTILQLQPLQASEISMGNRGSRHAGKVVLPDGSVREFWEPVTAAELMMEHPQQVVVEFSSKPSHPHKPTPLPADKSLELGRIYIMMPLRRGKIPSFSSQDSHQILLSVTALLRARSFLASSGSLHFLKRARPTSSGNGNRFEVPEREVEPEVEEDDEFSVGKNNCLSRQVSGKGWKPSLDTIKEKKEAGKDVNLVVLAGKVGRRIENKGLVWG